MKKKAKPAKRAQKKAAPKATKTKAKAPARATKKATAKAQPENGARASQPKTAETSYTPQPISGIGWPPFRYSRP